MSAPTPSRAPLPANPIPPAVPPSARVHDLAQVRRLADDLADELQFLAEIGRLFAEGCGSLHKVVAALVEMEEARRLPDYCSTRYQTAQRLPKRLQPLTDRVFSGAAELYRRNARGNYVGLTAEGEYLVALWAAYSA